MTSSMSTTIPSSIIYPGAGIQFSLAGLTVTLKNISHCTISDSSLYELQLAPYFQKLIPHRHRQTQEWLYVIHGVAAVTLDAQTVVARPGTLVLIPANTSHTFWNPGAGTTTLLGFRAGSALRSYLQALTQLLDNGMSETACQQRSARVTQLLALTQSHDLFLANPTSADQLADGQFML